MSYAIWLEHLITLIHAMNHVKSDEAAVKELKATKLNLNIACAGGKQYYSFSE